jgi:hypothetical protein
VVAAIRCSTSLGASPESASLVVGKPNSFFTELFSIDLVFGFEVVDEVLLAAVDPTRNKGENELEV